MGHWIGLGEVALAILVLLLATPVAVSNYLPAQKCGVDAEAVTGLVVSNLMVVAALPARLAVALWAKSIVPSRARLRYPPPQ